jgi:antitoxin HicB
MRTWIYPAVFAVQDDGEVLVTFPDFPDAATDGRSMDEARAMAADLLEEAVLGYLAHGRDVPTPSPVAKGREGVALEPVTAARAAVQVRMRAEKVSGVALAARMGKDEKVVRRILDGKGNVSMETAVSALRALGAQPVLST